MECLPSPRAFKIRVKHIGFLSFGHWSDAHGSQARTAVPEIADIEDDDEREAMLETAMAVVDEGGYGGGPVS